MTCSNCQRQPESGQPSFQRCAGCKSVCYCSKDCQRTHWKRHKQSCKTTALDNEAQNIASAHSEDTVVGIRLPCTKDGGDLVWDPERIPSNHAIFNTPLLPVPARLGIPLVIYRDGTQSSNRADLDCQLATFLNVNPADGFAPPAWQSHVGTCIVARKDKKPLSMEHFEAIRMYIDHLMDIFGDEGPQEAQDYLTKEEFESWFDNYKENEAENGRKEWEKVGSLYDV